MSLDTTFNPNSTFASDSMILPVYGPYSGNMFETGQSPHTQSASSCLELTNPNLSYTLPEGLYPLSNPNFPDLLRGLYPFSQVAGLASQAPLEGVSLASNGVGGFVPGDTFIGLDYNTSINPSAMSTNTLTGENGSGIASYTVQGGYGNYSPSYADYGIDISYLSQQLGIRPDVLVQMVQMNPNTLASAINQQAGFNISSSASNRDFVNFGTRNVFPPAFGFVQGSPYPSAYPFPLQGSSNWNSFPNTGVQRSVNPWA
jgi:hypothetical protein